MSQNGFLDFETPKGNKCVYLVKPAEGTVMRRWRSLLVQFRWRCHLRVEEAAGLYWLSSPNTSLPISPPFPSQIVLVRIVCICSLLEGHRPCSEHWHWGLLELVRASRWLCEVSGLVEWPGENMCKLRWYSASRKGQVLCRISFLAL